MSTQEQQLFIDMVGRLSWETQLHLDERHHHFYINKVIIILISLLLVVLAVINVYYVAILYRDLNGIVDNMDSMHTHMQRVSDRMAHITDTVERFEGYMLHMDSIEASTRDMARMMPSIRGHMDGIRDEIALMDENMARMSSGMSHIDQRFRHMTDGVAVMRFHVWTISRPMGAMNPLLP